MVVSEANSLMLQNGCFVLGDVSLLRQRQSLQANMEMVLVPSCVEWEAPTHFKSALAETVGECGVQEHRPIMWPDEEGGGGVGGENEEFFNG